MDNVGSTSIALILLLVGSAVFGATVVSVTSDGVNNEPTENDLTQSLLKITDETSDKITTYIQTTQVLGKYYGEPHNQKIEKIVIMIKSMISKNISLADLSIELNNGNSVIMLYYSGDAEFIGSNDVFEHPIWNNIDESSFGFIVTHDKDGSLVNYDKINDNTDMAYLIIKLPEYMMMSKGDTMTVTINPSNGITRIIDLEAPLPMKSIVSLNLLE